MTALLIGLALWVVAMVLAPHVGRALREARLHLDDATIGEPRSFHGYANGPWDEDPDHLFSLRGSTDPVEQGLTHSQLDRLHGPLTRIPHPKDPT